MPKISKRAQPRDEEPKLEHQQAQEIENERREPNPSQYRIVNEDAYSRSSEAQWEPPQEEIIKQEAVKDDQKSARSNFSSLSKRAPNEEDLCKAILCLRKKLPQRSLQQIIIRLHQAVEQTKSMYGNSSASKKFDTRSVNSRANDFDDSQSFFNFGGEEGQNFFHLESNHEAAFANKLELKEPNESHTVTEQSIPLKGKEQKQFKPYKVSLPPPISNLQLPEAGIDYIYKPKGQEIVVTFLERDTRKTKFINIEEQSRYVERRVMAKSFIDRGYGVSECRKEIEAQGLGFMLHRNTYKTLSGSVIILAFRKLESFMANELGKTIKFLDRWQMRSICTVMLNCRTTMQNQQMATLFKFIKASYGLCDVTIGEIEAVKLYLACQKFMYGKSVTMQTLERLGEIQHKKNIQLTLQYLNRKKMRRQQRLQKLRKQRLELKSSANGEGSSGSQEMNFQDLDHIKLEMESQFGDDEDMNGKLEVKTQGDGLTTLNGMVSNVQEPSLSRMQVELTQEHTQIKQEEFWNEVMDLQFANLYLQHLCLQMPIRIMQENYTELINWTPSDFIKKYQKILRKAVKKIQLQSQIIQNHCLPALCKLQKNEITIIINHPKAENIRHQLLDYFVLEEPSLSKLTSAVANIIKFLGNNKEAEEGAQMRQSWRRMMERINRQKQFVSSTFNTSQCTRYTYPVQQKLYNFDGTNPKNQRGSKDKAIDPEYQIYNDLNTSELAFSDNSRNQRQIYDSEDDRQAAESNFEV